MKDERYRKAAERFQLAPQEVEALVEFRRSREFLVVKGFLEGLLQRADYELENSNDLEEILRSQGSKRVVRQIFSKIEEIVKEVEEDNG